MNPIRQWAFALGVVTLGYCSNAHAGFWGDTMTLNLTVHDLVSPAERYHPFDNYVINPPDDEDFYNGYSDPVGANDSRYFVSWFVTVFDNKFWLQLYNDEYSNPIGPLLFSLTDIDGFDPITHISIGFNSLGIAPGNLSFTADSITISSDALGNMPINGALAVEILVVPEVSTVAMLSIVTVGIAGYVVRRRQANV